MKKKASMYTLSGIIICAVIIAVILWFQPHRKAADQQGIPITAEALFQAYSTDEQSADTQYLGKALEITGIITDIDTNQDGQMVIILDSGNPSGNIVCTFPDSRGTLLINQRITVKGFCAGMLTDVMVTDCIATSMR